MCVDKAACIIISADLGFNRRLAPLFPVLNVQLSLTVIFSVAFLFRNCSRQLRPERFLFIRAFHLRPQIPVFVVIRYLHECY